MSPVQLPEELTIYTVAAVAAQFEARLAEGGNLEADASAVTEADAAGIQLLLAGRLHARALDRSFTLVSPQAGLLSTFALLGLSFDTTPEATQ